MNNWVSLQPKGKWIIYDRANGGFSGFACNLLLLLIQLLVPVKDNCWMTTSWERSLKMKSSVCILFICVFVCPTANWSSTRSSPRMMPSISARQRTSRDRSSPWRGSSWWCQRTGRAHRGISEPTQCQAQPSSWLGTDLSITQIKLLLTPCITWRLKVSAVYTNVRTWNTLLIFNVCFIGTLRSLVTEMV